MTLGKQSACEYVFNGVVSGNATLFDEVILIPGQRHDWRAGARDSRLCRINLLCQRRLPPTPFEPMVEESMKLLDRYFAAVAKNFGDRVTCALSGGYDSRLILAMLRRHGVRPRVYVYGPRGDKDVALARRDRAR